jgi:iron complex outermembrane recepter protein
VPKEHESAFVERLRDWAVARTVLLLAILTSSSLPAWSQQNPADLTSRSLEDLMNIQVTSVSKTERPLSRTAAAIFVMTPEDIRRSGALNIPDLLRMVPGVEVAQINANTWAITARGFNAQFSNELLVLVDGRNVYTPTFGGVNWDVLDLPLEDIDRIEVIRGPGGSIWGSNAVNGVINIITKTAAATHGGLVVEGGGNVNQGFGTVQYGDSLGDSTDFRVFAKYFDQDHFPGLTGQDGADGWHILRGGFRMDTTLSPRDTLTVEGEIYAGREGDPTTFLPSVTSQGVVDINTQVDLSEGYIQSIWNHAYSARSDSTLQISYDSYARGDVLNENRKTFNADFQHHIAWGDRQDIVWGLGYRFSSSHTHGDLSFSLDPADLNTQIFSAFVQDEIALIPDCLYFTIGTKLEHNYYTGFGLMPNARLAYSPSGHQMFWAAVSRALRTPASLDTAGRINFGGFPGPGGVPVLVGQIGNPNYEDEDDLSYELGYRATVTDRLSFDFTAYFNRYTDQGTTEPAPPFFEPTPAPPHEVMPVTLQNLMFGETHGLELAANWKVMARWTISPGYAFERIHMNVSSASRDTTSVPETEGSDPHVQAQLRSHVDLSRGFTWDASAYFVDRLVFQKVPSYTRLDTGLTWQWKEGISLSIAGQNLLKDHHVEFLDTTGATRSTEVKRGAYAKLTWRL